VALFAIDNGNAEEVEINALQDRAKPLPKQDCSQQGIRERLDAIDNVRKETAVKSEQKERPVLASLHRHVLPPDGVACQGHGCPAVRNRPTARRHAGLDHGSFKSMIYAYFLISIDSCVNKRRNSPSGAREAAGHVQNFPAGTVSPEKELYDPRT
jgi:hypothetical protein